MPRRDYASHYPATVDLFSTRPLLQQEMERIVNNVPLEAIDLSRYKLSVPTGDEANDIDAWTRALELAKIQLEHQKLRLMNLELLKAFGENVARKSLVELDGILSNLDRESQQKERAILNTHKKRKLEQVRDYRRVSLVFLRL